MSGHGNTLYTKFYWSNLFLDTLFTQFYWLKRMEVIIYKKDSSVKSIYFCKLPAQSCSTKLWADGRMVKVLYQGSREKDASAAKPLRLPQYSEDISTDDHEMINQQVAFQSSSRKSTMVQTEHVVVMGDQDDVMEVCQKAFTSLLPKRKFNLSRTPVEIWCTEEFSSTPFSTTKKDEQQLLLEDIQKSQKEMAENISTLLSAFQTSSELNITPLLNSFQSYGNEKENSQSTPDNDVPYSDRHSSITQQKTDDCETTTLPLLMPPTRKVYEQTPIPFESRTMQPEVCISPTDSLPFETISLNDIDEAVSSAVSKVLDSDENRDPHTISVDLEPHSDENVQPKPMLKVLQPQNDENIRNMKSSVVSPSKTDGQVDISCPRNATIVEVSSPDDIIPGNCEFVVQKDIVSKKLSSACSAGNFLWLMTKILFKEEDLVNKNYSGKKGKTPLSPRRKHTLQHLFVENYGRQNSEFVKAIGAVNNGILKVSKKFRNNFD